MKIRTIIILLTIVFITFLIYMFNQDKKIYILSLGNSNIYEKPSYIDKLGQELEKRNILEENINITSEINEILDDIKANKKIQDKLMKNHLIKADIIFVTTTSSKDNLNELIKVIKKYSKEKIIIIGPNTKDNQIISKKYQIELLNIDLKQNQNDMIYANLLNFTLENANNTWKIPFMLV